MDKFLIFACSMLLLVCCQSNNISNQEVLIENYLKLPDTTFLLENLKFDKSKALWFHGDILASGTVLSYYPNDSLKQKFGIFRGRKQNESFDWYPDGHLRNYTNYQKGKLHGIKKTWTSDSLHVQIAEFNFKNGHGHGKQTKWYNTGELYQELNLNMGKEEGMQKAYRKNGDLYANYEARDGRIFGLKKAALCFELENEIIQHAD